MARRLRFERFEGTGRPYLVVSDEGGRGMYKHERCERCQAELDISHGKYREMGTELGLAQEGALLYKGCQKPKLVLEGMESLEACRDLIRDTEERFLPKLPVFGRVGPNSGDIILYTHQDLNKYLEALESWAAFIKGERGVESEMFLGSLTECYLMDIFQEVGPPEFRRSGEFRVLKADFTPKSPEESGK